MKREDFPRPEYSIFENIWVVDNLGKVFKAEWIAYSHSFSTVDCPEFQWNRSFNISRIEIGELNTRENAIKSAMEHLSKSITYQELFIKSQKGIKEALRVCLLSNGTQ